MSDKPNESGEIKFKSADIKKKEKPEYFKNTTKTNPVKDFFSSALKHIKGFVTFAFKGSRRFLSIGILIVLAVAITCLILWLTVWRQSDSGPIIENPEIAWRQQLGDISSEARSILDSDSDTAFIDAINFLDEKVASAENDTQRFDLRITRAGFLNDNGGAQLALTDLLHVDDSDLTDQQKITLYQTIFFAYRVLDDEHGMAEYQAKIDMLPSEITDVWEEEE